MISSLRSDEIDLAIGLTEGWVAGLLTPQGKKEQGYSIVGTWVETPLRWAIVTGARRSEIKSVDDLKGGRVAVSRLGSGSHVMAFVLAQQEGWLEKDKEGGLEIVPVGPFKELRDAVGGDWKGGDDKEKLKGEFFMWEHFTTKGYFTGPDAELKKVGEIYTPWPSWHIAASTSTFPKPEDDERLRSIFEALDQGIAEYDGTGGKYLGLLETGELGCHYGEEDAREWAKGVRFVPPEEGTRGVKKSVLEGVVKVLKGAGVIGEGESVDGIRRIER